MKKSGLLINGLTEIGKVEVLFVGYRRNGFLGLSHYV